MCDNLNKDNIITATETEINSETTSINSEMTDRGENIGNQKKVRKVIQVQQQHKFVKLIKSEEFGFGFVLRGQRMKKQLQNKSGNSNFRPSALCPSKQFLETLDEMGPANLAGLTAGDYLINVNNEDVTNWNHEDVVKLIRSHKVITLHVISVSKGVSRKDNYMYFNKIIDIGTIRFENPVL